MVNACPHTLYKGGEGGGVAGESLYTHNIGGGEKGGGVQGVIPIMNIINRGVDTRSATISSLCC